ncbi:DJ-1/PfpI/YhbO family deglycase/protease [Thermodesulfitimonas sp.]
MGRKAAVLLLVILFATALGGCGKPAAPRPQEERKPPAAGPAEKPRPTKELAGKRLLLVIAPRNFRDEEFFVPRRLFQEQGVQVTVASSKQEMATGMRGGTVTPDTTFAGVDPATYDAIVIAGGTGSREYLWDNSELRRIVQQAFREKKVVAAICLSPVVLARAGCLTGKEATVWPDPAAVQELSTAGAKYVDRSVVVAGNVVTAKDPQSAEAFAQAVAELLRPH